MIFVPDTGDRQLNLVLEQLASNVGNVTATTANTVVYNTDGSYSAAGTILGYRNRWMYVIFSSDGYGTNATPLATNKGYYGISNTVEEIFPTNELSYSYKQVSGGFGTDKSLYYKTTGGRNIQWQVGTTAPGGDWVAVPNTATEYVAIDLDTVTVASGASGADGYSSYQASIYKTATTTPTTPTGGSYTFSTKTLVTPSGWYSNVPSAGTSNVYVSSFLFSSNVSDSITATTWSQPTAVFRNGTDGAPGAPGINGTNGANGITSIVGIVYQANAVTPLAIGTTGTYDFSTATLTAPTGWSATIPSTSASTPVWSSMATFRTTDATATVSNTTSWTTPAMTFQSGSVGQAGTRGIIPMAYVITTVNPLILTSAQLTDAFAAARTNSSAPIGTGYQPIAGDTAQFSHTGSGISVVKSYDGSNWINSVGQVINGSLLITGSVTSTTLKSNDVYALSMRGGSVISTTDTSNVGFFLDAGSGNALFTGDVRVGNLIQNNALLANTVTTTTIVPSSVTDTSFYRANTGKYTNPSTTWFDTSASITVLNSGLYTFCIFSVAPLRAWFDATKSNQVGTAGIRLVRRQSGQSDVILLQDTSYGYSSSQSTLTSQDWTQTNIGWYDNPPSTNAVTYLFQIQYSGLTNTNPITLVGATSLELINAQIMVQTLKR
jgi:hypothetical protein